MQSARSSTETRSSGYCIQWKFVVREKHNKNGKFEFRFGHLAAKPVFRLTRSLWHTFFSNVRFHFAVGVCMLPQQAQPTSLYKTYRRKRSFPKQIKWDFQFDKMRAQPEKKNSLVCSDVCNIPTCLVSSSSAGIYKWVGLVSLLQTFNITQCHISSSYFTLVQISQSISKFNSLKVNSFVIPNRYIFLVYHSVRIEKWQTHQHTTAAIKSSWF